MRNALALGCLTVVLGGCGGGGVSLTEYAETLGPLSVELVEQLEALDDRMSTGTATIEDAREVLVEALDLRAEYQDGLTSLDPPEEVADFHAKIIVFHAQMISAQEAVAARAKTATGLEELDQSAEALVYQAMWAEAILLCEEMQVTIDATADRGIFVDTPWVPSDLKEIIEVTFGCADE